MRNLPPVGGVLTVHEWGTFTSLQDETGRDIPNIAADEEPLPDFVHEAAPRDMPRAVTMRLETPVLYFYPTPPDDTVELDVRVAFESGALTQFYPEAEARPGELWWRNLRVGGHAPGPPTRKRVWTAPRETGAASVATPHGERERYVFYRGIGHLASPLRVARPDGLTVFSELPSVSRLWLVEVRRDGAMAFRVFSLRGPLDGPLAALTSGFDAHDFSTSHFTALRRSMHTGLVESGLFPDEADAMLNTWEVSYFRGPGQRLFYLVPQAWTDAKLPLKLSVPARVTRVMVGRVELVTPEQRRLLHEMAEGKHVESAYRSLGRFRAALVLDAAAQRNSPQLEAFIVANDLRGRSWGKGLRD